MADFEIPENPDFVESVRKFEPTDPAHADLFNRVILALLESLAYLRKYKADTDYVDASYQQGTGYTDKKIADLINGAPETLDTLKEIADAIAENKTIVEALDSAIGKKANQTELDTHVSNNTIHITGQERTNWNDANSKKHSHSNKSVLDGITSALINTWNKVTDKLDKTGGMVTGDIIPNTNELIDLGNSAKKWDNVWTHTLEADYINAQEGIHGNLTGNADTATKAVKDSAGDNIITSYRKRMGSVPDNDFNNATVEGVYTYGSSTGIANAYTNGGVWGTLEVFNNGYNSTQGVAGTVIHQIAFTTNNRIYFRQRINAWDWTVWKELTTKFSNGEIKVTNPAYSNGYVRAWVDNEGGNIQIQASNGKTYEIDSYNSDVLRLFASDDNGNNKFAYFNRNTGALSADGGFAGNAASAAKLATARNINGIKFDGTSDIQLPLYYSYSFGVTQNAIYYSSFCRMKKDNVTSECETTLLLSATGNFGGTVPGTYLISMSNRGQKATMTVVCLQKSLVIILMIHIFILVLSDQLIPILQI